MKAAQLRQPQGLDHLEVSDLPEAGPPGPREIQVRIRASSLNFHDFAVVAGMIPTEDGRIPMSDGAGEVVAVGAEVSAFKVGDRVVSTFFPDWLDGEGEDGGFTRVPGDGIDGYAREGVTAPETAFTHAPRGWSHEESATITCAGLTAWRALIVNGRLKAGDTVLIQGSGGVSVFALQIAKAMGASVIATSSSDEKLERLKALGADHLVNYKSTPAWGRQALEITGGRGVDHVVEIGGPGTLPQSITAARVSGHIALIGVLTGVQGEIPTALMMRKQLRVQGLIVGSRRHQLDFVRALEAVGLRPVIDSRFPLEGLADAFRRQIAGQHFGKIAVMV